jgi:two-component system response regulator AtoC
LQISAEAMELLQRYHWPGNVRELRSVIQTGEILCQGGLITPADLPEEIRRDEASAGQRLQALQQQIHLPPEGLDLPAFLGSIERTLVQEALEYCNGNQVQAAALLHISRDQLRYRLSREKLAPHVSSFASAQDPARE